MNIDIGNIIFSDLVAKLQNGKKGREPNSVGQSKGSTDKRSKKKKNPSSSEPKTSKIIRETTSKKQVVETQHVEKSVATADATKSREASRSAEELKNQPKLADSEKEHEKLVEVVVNDPRAINSMIRYLGNVNLKELYQGQDVNMEADDSPFNTWSEIKFIRKVDTKKTMMLIIHLLVLSLIKKWDVATNVTDESDFPVSTVSASSSAPKDVQALIVKAVWEKNSQGPLGHLPKRLDFLSAQVNNVVNYLPNKLTQRFDLAVSTILKIISDAIAQQLPTLLTVMLKDTLLQALTNAVRYTLSTFKKQIQKAIKKKMPKVGEKQSSDPEPPTSSALLVYSDFVKPQAKKHKVVINIHIPVPTPLNSIRPVTFKNVPFEQFTAYLFGSSSFEFSPTPSLRMADKGNGVAQTSDDDQLNQIMPLMEEGGSTPKLPNLHQFNIVGEGSLTLEESMLQMQDIKRIVDLKGEKEKSEKKLKRDDPLPITKFSYRGQGCKEKLQSSDGLLLMAPHAVDADGSTDC
nr:hypothetical protein [Tanacetum cinerariifolium]